MMKAYVTVEVKFVTVLVYQGGQPVYHVNHWFPSYLHKILSLSRTCMSQQPTASSHKLYLCSKNWIQHL